VLDLPWEAGLAGGLARALADHERHEAPQPPGGRLDPDLARELQAVCVHTPGYGTRSATLLASNENGLQHYLFADGSPCVSPFVAVRGGGAVLRAGVSLSG
jgi:hypothetical protein